MQQVRIDFDNPGLPQSLGVVEGESQSRIFQAALYKSGAAYTAPAGAVYSIMYRGFGPQNQGWYDTIEDGAGKRAACTVSGNVVTCELARQALRVPGHLTVVLCISDAKGYMLKSWPIMADVRNDGYEDTGEIEIYFNLSGLAGNYLTQLEKAIANAETTKNTLTSTSAQVQKDIDAKAAAALESIPEEYTELDGSVKQLKEDIGDIKSVIPQKYDVVEPISEDHTIYSNAFPSGYTEDVYTTYYYNAKSGDKFFVDTQAIGGLYGIATFLTADNKYIGGAGIGAEGFQYNYEITIPESEFIAKMCISSLASIKDAVKCKIIGPSDIYKDSMVYGGINKDGQIFIKKKRNNTEDLCVIIAKTVGNELYGFTNVFKVENNSTLNTDIKNSDSRNILSIPTDIFSPFIVKATTNIDGDLPDGYKSEFTGGSHQYNNTASGSSHTARTSNVRVFADNTEIKNEFRFAKKIRVEFDNYVQANNTKKADGSGREVLKEHWTIVADSSGFKCHNEITALEPITISRYYGLQTYTLSDSWYLIGGRVTPFTSGSDNGYSEGKECNSVKCSSAALTVYMELENYGLGAKSYASGVAYSMAKIGLKTYPSLIYDDLSMTKGDKLFVRGNYLID